MKNVRLNASVYSSTDASASRRLSRMPQVSLALPVRGQNVDGLYIAEVPDATRPYVT
jgi:hypothetical protein